MKKHCYINNICFHIFNRGTRRLNAFFEEQDYAYFIKKLKFYAVKFKLSVLSFSLVPNHFHLQIGEIDDKRRVSLLMHRLGTTYGWYFRSKYKKCGHVFQDTYKWKLVDNSFYLIHLARYIHQNPIELAISKGWNRKIKYMQCYKWSSYRYYLNEQAPEWLNISVLMRFFPSKDAFIKFMETPILKWEREEIEGNLI